MTTIDAGAFTFYPYGLALAAGALASLLLMRLLSRGHRLVRPVCDSPGRPLRADPLLPRIPALVYRPGR